MSNYRDDEPSSILRRFPQISADSNPGPEGGLEPVSRRIRLQLHWTSQDSFSTNPTIGYMVARRYGDIGIKIIV